MSTMRRNFNEGWNIYIYFSSVIFQKMILVYGWRFQDSSKYHVLRVALYAFFLIIQCKLVIEIIDGHP